MIESTQITADSMFQRTYLALCSNPTVVTLIPKQDSLLGATNGQREMIPHIQPFIVMLASRLTALYLSLDQQEIVADIEQNVEKMKADITKSMAAAINAR